MSKAELTETPEYSFTEFRKNAEEVCGRIFFGECATLLLSGKPFATLRSVDEGGLPEDGKYEFVSLSSFKRTDSVADIGRAFEEGNAVIIKDHGRPEDRKYPTHTVSGHRNKNIVVILPL